MIDHDKHNMIFVMQTKIAELQKVIDSSDFTILDHFNTIKDDETAITEWYERMEKHREIKMRVGGDTAPIDKILRTISCLLEKQQLMNRIKLMEDDKDSVSRGVTVV